MGWLQTVHRGTWVGPHNLKDPALAELYSDGRRSSAGPLVNELTAFTCSAFWDGVNQISSDTAKQPLNLLLALAGGGSRHYTESRTYRLMKFRPNPETSTMQLRRTMTAHALVYGNGYAEIVRDALGRPTAIWLLHPKRVRPYYAEVKNTDGTTVRKPLRYDIDSGQVELLPMDILHITGPSDDAVVGWNLVSVAREALGLALASQAFASAFFGNGTRFGGVLTTDQDVDEDQEKEIRERIERIHAKADKAFRLLVLGGGFKFEQSGVKPNEAEMTKIRDQQVEEIARFLNMPLAKLKVNRPGAVSYASSEMQDLDYWKGPMLTWATTWEQELDAKLISSFEWGRQYFKHNTNAFLRGDIKSRYEALGIALDKGVINADQWRELEDWNPQEDGQGKLYLVQGAMVPKNKLVEIVEAKIVKDTTPPPAPALPPGGGGDDDSRGQLMIAARAQALLEAARTSYQAEHDARVAAEARVEATAAEIEARRLSESEALTRLTTFEVLANDRRREAEAAIAAREQADTARAAAEREVDVARARAATAQADAEVQARARDEALAARERFEADTATALAAACAAEARAVAAEHAATEARSEANASRSGIVVAEEQAATARAEAEQARTDMLRIEADAATARAAADAAEARAAAAEQAAEVTRAAHAMAEAAVAEAAAALEQQRVRRDEVQAEQDRLLVEAREAAQAAEARAVAAEQALQLRQTELAATETSLAEMRTTVATAAAAQQRISAELAEAREAHAMAQTMAAAAMRDAERSAEEAGRVVLNLTSERDERIARNHELEQRAIEATAARDGLAADLAAATTGREELTARLTDAERVVAEAQRAAREAADAVATAETARAEAERQASAATQLANQELAEMGAERDALRAQVAELERARNEARARGVESEQSLHEALGARDDAERRATAATTAASDADLAREQARVGLSEAEARAIAAETSRADLAQRLTTSRRAQLDRLAGVVASHRALIVDVVGRLVARETDRARSRQQAPDKLRAWLETFYGPFEDQFVDAVLPAVRVHLAWKHSSEDPRDVAIGMAQRYCDASKTQLRAFLGSTPEDFHVAVDHLLKRWERDRPAAIADALLEEEIAHLKELEAQS